MKNKQFAVIGLGRFGDSLIRELISHGYEVLAIDVDNERVNESAEVATQAVQADAMDEQALKQLGIRNFDVVVVAIGHNIQANILTTIILKEMGVKKVIAKAENKLHGKVLEKIGADLVIYPERDMAVKLARTLISKNILEEIKLSSDYSIIELIAPKVYADKSIKDLKLRQKTGITILAIKQGNDILVSPGPEQVISRGDIMVVLGRDEDLAKINQLES
ncbi:MAG TPA: TrkA family potassium uptake protein [Syntrophomonadaceae bacterium]|nr:TrkA family potassium uptake protein [Syntrophomonadaceae bacterium]